MPPEIFEKQLLQYSFKVWLTAAVIAPSLLAFNAYFHGVQIDMEGYFSLIIFLIVTAIPSTCVFYFAVFYLEKYLTGIPKLKIALSVTGAAFAFVLLFISNKKRLSTDVDLPFYLAVIGSIWLYVIRPEEREAMPVDETDDNF